MPDGEFNASAHYGSASGVLEGIVNMKSLIQYPPRPRQNDDRFGPPQTTTDSQTTTLDILGHEFAHRWGAYVRFRDSGRNDSDKLLEDPETRPDKTPRHWSFFVDSDASVLFGNDWRHRPRRPSPLNTFQVTAVTQGYSPLDLYLMGLLPPEQVPDFFYIADSPDEPVVGRSALPDIGFGTRGTRVDVSIQDVIDATGPRVPDVAGAPHVFRQAFVLIVLSGQRPAMTDIINDVRRLEKLRQAWHTWFRANTHHLGRIDSRLP